MVTTRASPCLALPPIHHCLYIAIVSLSFFNLQEYRTLLKYSHLLISQICSHTKVHQSRMVANNKKISTVEQINLYYQLLYICQHWCVERTILGMYVLDASHLFRKYPACPNIFGRRMLFVAFPIQFAILQCPRSGPLQRFLCYHSISAKPLSPSSMTSGF